MKPNKAKDETQCFEFHLFSNVQNSLGLVRKCYPETLENVHLHSTSRKIRARERRNKMHFNEWEKKHI